MLKWQFFCFVFYIALGIAGVFIPLWIAKRGVYKLSVITLFQDGEKIKILTRLKILIRPVMLPVRFVRITVTFVQCSQVSKMFIQSTAKPLHSSQSISLNFVRILYFMSVHQRTSVRFILRVASEEHVAANETFLTQFDTDFEKLRKLSEKPQKCVKCKLTFKAYCAKKSDTGLQ